MQTRRTILKWLGGLAASLPFVGKAAANVKPAVKLVPTPAAALNKSEWLCNKSRIVRVLGIDWHSYCSVDDIPEALKGLTPEVIDFRLATEPAMAREASWLRNNKAPVTRWAVVAAGFDRLSGVLKTGREGWQGEEESSWEPKPNMWKNLVKIAKENRCDCIAFNNGGAGFVCGRKLKMAGWPADQAMPFINTWNLNGPEVIKFCWPNQQPYWQLSKSRASHMVVQATKTGQFVVPDRTPVAANAAIMLATVAAWHLAGMPLPYIDVNPELDEITKMLAKVCNSLGIKITPGDIIVN